jgi:ATP:ADP antiporter, AAA family
MAEFSSLRSFLWPIHRFELKKFIPILIMFFLIAFNYNLLRAVKDAIIVTAPSSGAEAIPFIKMWVILPMAVLITYIFTKLSNRFNREKVFYIMMSLFLSYFLIFTFILYPYQNTLHPHEFSDFLSSLMPKGFQGMISIVRNWIFTSFYVMSELWSSAILTVLFWGFVNGVCKVEEAKRFYGTLCVGANIASILSGQVTQFFCTFTFNPLIPFGNTGWDQSIIFINLTIVLFGLLIMLTFRWLNKNVLSNAKSAHYRIDNHKKHKGSFRENFRYLAKSKYLICIAILVISYNLTMNLVEVVWKNQVKLLYPSPQDYSHYMGQVITAIGITATLISLFVSTGVIRRCGWTFTALVTPIVILITGVTFFSFLLFDELKLTTITALLGASPIALSVFFGSLQNTLSRASKFTLFDATKEMSFVPLSEESKHRGKAAIDGVGSRFGKSGGSILQIGMIGSFGSIINCVPCIAIIFLIVIGFWVFSIISLGKQFKRLTAKDSLEEKTTSKPATEALG